MDGKIEYLNTDLDLISSEDLTEITAALEANGVFPLSVTHGDDGLWYSTLETSKSFDEPEPNINAMIDAIESLSAPLRAVWSRCSTREFDVGYDCGTEPWAFNQRLSCELLGRMATAGTAFRITLYPDRPDSDDPSSQSEDDFDDDETGENSKSSNAEA